MQAEHSARQLGIPLCPTVGTKTFQHSNAPEAQLDSLPKVNYIDANRAIFVYYDGDSLPTLDDHFNRSLHTIGNAKGHFKNFPASYWNRHYYRQCQASKLSPNRPGPSTHDFQYGAYSMPDYSHFGGILRQPTPPMWTPYGQQAPNPQSNRDFYSTLSGCNRPAYSSILSLPAPTPMQKSMSKYPSQTQLKPDWTGIYGDSLAGPSTSVMPPPYGFTGLEPQSTMSEPQKDLYWY